MRFTYFRCINALILPNAHSNRAADRYRPMIYESFTTVFWYNFVLTYIYKKGTVYQKHSTPIKIPAGITTCRGDFQTAKLYAFGAI